MRYLIFILMFAFAGLNAQQEKVVSQEEDTQDIVIYGDNSNQLNEGYIKNNKLHGYWAGYDKQEKTLSFGKYDQGKKVGQWFFWSEGNLSRINYNNSISRD